MSNVTVTGITQETPANIPFGAGVFFSGVKYDETTAPTATEIVGKVMGATQEGGKITITPEFFEPDLDGKNVSVMELIQKVGETAIMETTMVEMNAERVARAVIGQIAENTGKTYDVITSSELRKGHFYQGFGYYGELLDGRPFICMFKNALCTNGFGYEGKNKENGKFAGTFECKSDIEYGVKKLPYALFIRKATGWTKTTPDEITKTTTTTGT